MAESDEDIDNYFSGLDKYLTIAQLEREEDLNFAFAASKLEPGDLHGMKWVRAVRFIEESLRQKNIVVTEGELVGRYRRSWPEPIRPAGLPPGFEPIEFVLAAMWSGVVGNLTYDFLKYALKKARDGRRSDRPLLRRAGGNSDQLLDVVSKTAVWAQCGRHRLPFPGYYALEVRKPWRREQGGMATTITAEGGRFRADVFVSYDFDHGSARDSGRGSGVAVRIQCEAVPYFELRENKWARARVEGIVRSDLVGRRWRHRGVRGRYEEEDVPELVELILRTVDKPLGRVQTRLTGREDVGPKEWDDRFGAEG